MAITAEQAQQLTNLYQSGNTGGLQSLVNQFGVTQDDVSKYFPNFDAKAAGISLLAPIDYGSLVTKAYADIGRSGFGESAQNIDKSGYDYWTGQLKSGAMSPEQFKQSFGYAAAPAVVTQAYKNIFGREADAPGAEFYTQKLRSGELTADNLRDALAYGAQGLEDRLKAQKAIGKEIFAPEEYLKGTSGYGYKDITDYINANIQDPVKIAQAAARYGVSAEEILQAKKAVGEKDIPGLEAIKDYLNQGSAGLGTRVQDIISKNIGDAELIKTIEGALPQSASRVASFTPQSLSTKSIEEIEKAIAESPTNKLQEAGRIRGLAETVFGMSADDARKLAGNLYSGSEKDSYYKKVYNDLLTKGFDKDVQYEIFSKAAKENPNSKFFKENPNALVAYTPLQEQTGKTGVYGYVNDAPILNAKFADEKLGEKNQVIPHLGSVENNFGWTTNSKYTETVMRGPAIFGVEFNNRNDIEKAVDIENRIKNGTVLYDNEFNQFYDSRTASPIQTPTSDNERKGYYPGSANTLAKLQEAAQKVGINPANYKSAGDLFDAIEDKTKNLYQVVGRAIDWDPNAAKNLGITQTSGGRGGVNQANVLYERIGDKLIPVTAKAFEFHDPNTSRGFFGDIATSVAKIPFAAEIATAASGGNPLVYAALKGAQTMALGGDLEDAFKSAGLAYLTSSFIPKNITPNVQMALAQNSLVSSLAQASPQLANFIIDGGTRAVISSGLAAITGQDPEKAALSALVQSGIGTLTTEGLSLANIPQEYRSIVSNILSTAVLGGDTKKSLTGAATGLIQKEFNDLVKEQKSQTSTTKETKI